MGRFAEAVVFEVESQGLGNIREGLSNTLVLLIAIETVLHQRGFESLFEQGLAHQVGFRGTGRDDFDGGIGVIVFHRLILFVIFNW